MISVALNGMLIVILLPILTSGTIWNQLVSFEGQFLLSDFVNLGLHRLIPNRKQKDHRFT
jgi:hypothetical protein